VSEELRTQIPGLINMSSLLTRASTQAKCLTRTFHASAPTQKEKIAMIGSGNFGSALTRILGANAAKLDTFDDEVKMYVYEEVIDGKNLTDIINHEHENVKYLKGAKFTPNVVACPSLEETCA
jgi:glutamate dehydrogenase/leucine dehydrogenase